LFNFFGAHDKHQLQYFPCFLYNPLLAHNQTHGTFPPTYIVFYLNLVGWLDISNFSWSISMVKGLLTDNGFKFLKHVSPIIPPHGWGNLFLQDSIFLIHTQ
jgi:hypothetical protein